MNDDAKKHQAELAASGYRLPDSMYVAPATTDQASTEETSGDGGKANAELGPDDSEHGYKGELTTAADASRATLERSARAARAARNDRETPAEVGLRVATEGHIAVGAAAARTAAPGATMVDPRAGVGGNAGNSSSDSNGSGVAYASSAAEEAARDAGLTDADFAGRKASGEKGYTKADVDAIAGEKGSK